MSSLLQELVDEASKSNKWAADRLEAEARKFDELPRSEAALAQLRQSVEGFFSVATEFVIRRVPQVEGFWQSGLSLLRKDPADDGAVSFLQSILGVVESCLKLVLTMRREGPRIGATLELEPKWLEHTDELDRAEQKLLTLASEVKKALRHRMTPWQPADPDRLAKGLQLAREGKTVSADEARAWYSR